MSRDGFANPAVRVCVCLCALMCADMISKHGGCKQG